MIFHDFSWIFMIFHKNHKIFRKIITPKLTARIASNLFCWSDNVLKRSFITFWGMVTFFRFFLFFDIKYDFSWIFMIFHDFSLEKSLCQKVKKIWKISTSPKNVVNERFGSLSDQQKRFEVILTVHFGVTIF